MDAIMFALVAVSLANADGRVGSFLSELLTVRSDRRAVVGVAFGAFAANAAVAAAAGVVASRTIGQGLIQLLVAFAMLSAAISLVWRRRAVLAAGTLADAAPVALAVRMLLSQFGDRSHFLIGALAATSGAGQWAAVGGAIGWLLALLPFLAFGSGLAAQRPARIICYTSALTLMLWGLRTAMTAFGL